MSELLAQWLNERVGLSRPVTNFEKDFANGYLLGELLFKLDLQTDFAEFRNDFLPKSIVGNFNRASQTLQSIGVKFTSTMANELMNGSPGAAVRVIHQIKLTEKRLAKAQEAKGVKVSRLPAIGSASPVSTVPIPPTADFRSRPQFESMERKVLSQRLTETVHAARRGDDMGRHLQKFEAAKAHQGLAAEAELQREKELEVDRKNMTRQMTIDQYKAGVASRKDSELRGTAQLSRHLEAVQHREQEQLRFELTEHERRRRAKLAKSAEARTEVEGGIDAFERTLQKMAGADGAPLNPSPEPVDSARSPSPQSPETAAEDGAAFLQSLAKRLPPRAAMQQRAQQEMARIKQKTSIEQAARVERDRRRRKLLADEQGLVAQQAQQQREHALARGDSRPASVAERELEADEWRVQQTAELFVANATLVNRLVKDREEADRVEALDRDKLAYEADKASFNGEVKAQSERAEEARAAKKRARHNENAKYCRGVAQRIVDIAVKAATFRELSDSPLVPPKVWREWMTLFVTDRSILPSEAAAPGANNEIEQWLHTSLQQLQDVNEDSAESLDESMFEEYLATKGLWADKHFAGSPVDPSDPVLGAVVEKLVRLSSGAEDKPEFPRVAPSPLGVCLLGKPFSGKRTQARVLAERFGLKVLRLSELLEEAVQAANELSADAKAKAAKSKEPNGGLPVLPALGLKAAQFTTKGKPVPDDLAVALIGEAVRKAKAASAELRAAMEAAEAKGERPAAPAGSGGWLLADFPQTEAQARLLEKELSGYEPPAAPAAGVPKITKNPKEKVVSKVAPPPAEPAAPPTDAPVPSGIDLVLRLTVDHEAATRRALGRRVDPVTNQEYHIDSNPPPEDLPIKARLVPPPENASLEATLPKLLTEFEDAAGPLAAWFAPFKTLTEVAGSDAVESVSRALSDRLKDAVAEKEKQAAELKAAEEARAAEERGRREQEIKAEALAKEAVSSDVRAAEHAEERARAEREEAKAKEKSKDKAEKRATGRSESPAAGPAASPSGPAPGAGPAPSDVPERTAAELAADFANFRKFSDKPLAQSLTERWIAVEKGYTDQLKRLFRVLRKERWSSLEHFAALRKGFLRFLQRPHDNNALVQAFQAEFNAIDADLRKDIEVKEELHQRADELGDKLWEATSQRKAEAQQLLRSAAQDGWLERHADQLVGHYSYMIQLELDRYVQSINTSRDFLSALSGLPIAEKQFPSVALPIAEIAASLPFGSGPAAAPAAGAKAAPKSAKKGGPAAAPVPTGDEPVWKHCAFVVDTASERLKQLAQKAKDALVPPTVSDAPSEPADSKAKAPAAKDKAKDPKAKKEAAPTVSLQTLPDPQCQAQLIAVVTKQNEILVRRIESVLRCALDSVEELRQYTEQEERKLDQWLSLRVKGESSAIDALLRTLKEAIEKSLPLYYPLRLEGEDLLIERHFLSTPLPQKASSPVAPPPQGPYPLSWDQLNNLHAYLKAVAPDGFITNSALVGLLLRMAAHSSGNALVAGSGGKVFSPLPPRWCTLDRRDLEAVVGPFDTTGSHRISWRAFLMALALPPSVPTPTLQQLSTWQAALKLQSPSEDRRVSLAQLSGHPVVEAFPESARWIEFVFGVLSDPSTDAGTPSLDYGRLLAHLCFGDDQLTGQQKLNHVLPDHVAIAGELILSRILVALPN